MADNPPPLPPQNSGLKPTLPAIGSTGRPPTPRKSAPGKIVVMLSSVAKPPPAGAQPSPHVVPAMGEGAPIGSTPKAGIVLRPPTLPPKQVVPAAKIPGQTPTKLSTTTYVKLPPKTGVPQLTPLSSPTSPPSVANPVPVPAAEMPLQPGRRAEPAKKGVQLIPPIKLHSMVSPEEPVDESILLKEGSTIQPPQPVFPQGETKSPPPLPAPQVQDTSVPAVIAPRPPSAPPALPAAGHLSPPTLSSTTTMPLSRPSATPPQAKVTEPAVNLPPALQVAPPMLERVPEPVSEKLPPPNLPPAPQTIEPPEDDSAASTSIAAPRESTLVQSEIPGVNAAPPTSYPQPILPPESKKKRLTSWLKKVAPPALSTTRKTGVPPPTEAKPLLMPVTLPRRAQQNSDNSALPSAVAGNELADKIQAPVDDAMEIIEPPKQPEKTMLPSVTSSLLPPPAEKAELPRENEPGTTVETPSVAAAGSGSTSARDEKGKGNLKPEIAAPMNRAARAKKRRFAATVAFYVVMAITLAVLYFGSLYVGRETRIEGQVIPPAGMTLNNEVWIVSDFRELAAGITEDLAKDRAPLLEEIQERQSHVQRAQADVASREERIRVIQEEIQAAKDEIANVVKQARDATQQIWDVDGAQIDQDYASRMSELQRTIASRAKSLNLKYEPDPNFQSPEVWANAYRLALYQVPAGVDSVKEHQWLSDQLKQWRDFQKTLDQRKEALRDKAVQIKTEPAPKITDLSAKIAELQQRVDGTAAEEVPLKAELQQAQEDLVAAHAVEAGLDDKYYKQLDALPEEAITKHIPLRPNGRFSWLNDDVFAVGEVAHHYWMFCRATRPDGRQYWMLTQFSIEKDHKLCFLIEPESFISTKAILRPNLSPEEQAE